MLRSYLRSGWAFLIPYLALYLLYNWLGWPANPGFGGAIPSLLHMYWVLHGAHGVVVLWELYRWRRAATGGPGRALGTVLPWIALGLVLLIPRAYFEWPSDPWEHLRRIQEWEIHPALGSHSAGYKSFYFFAYSFLGLLEAPAVSFGTDLYVMGVGLLLLWQYYRLALALGLEPRWAAIFLVLNLVTFGNSCFSFYRYYGLASTMYSQIAAVALVRIAVLRFRADGGLSSLLAGCWRDIAAGAMLLALIATNHVQGIAIAGLGVLGGAGYWLVRTHRYGAWWILGTLSALSVATVLWWPRHPLVAGDFRAGGWLTSWYAFNFFAPSPVVERSMHILGALGLVNLGAGVWLMRRNEPAGWLTVGPVAALMIPVFALPFANALAGKSAADIVTFHRLLFAIPSGLSLVCCLRDWADRAHGSLRSRALAPVAAFALLLALVLLEPGRFSYNRFWHLLAVTPSDQRLIPLVNAAEADAGKLPVGAAGRLAANEAVTYVFSAIAPRRFPFKERPIGTPPTASLHEAVVSIRSSRPADGARPSLTRDPGARDPAAWTTVGGAAPAFVSVDEFPAADTALQNPPGRLSEVLTREFIPIAAGDRLRLEMSIRQHGGSGAVGRLAVAWYGEDGLVLPALTAAGNPAGWDNGTYSYFALFPATHADAWTTYRFSFGAGETAAIPARARYLRVGALLNITSAPGATVQLTNVRVWKKASTEPMADGEFPSWPPLFAAAPSSRWAVTPSSQAAQAAQHWPPQQVATDLAGGAEIAAAAAQASGTPMRPDSLLWRLDPAK